MLYRKLSDYSATILKRFTELDRDAVSIVRNFVKTPFKRAVTTTVTRLHGHHFQLSQRKRISQIEGLEGWKGRRRGMYRSDWLRCRSGIIYYNPARRASLFVHSPESLPVHRVLIYLCLYLVIIYSTFYKVQPTRKTPVKCFLLNKMRLLSGFQRSK